MPSENTTKRLTAMGSTVFVAIVLSQCGQPLWVAVLPPILMIVATGINDLLSSSKPKEDAPASVHVKKKTPPTRDHKATTEHDLGPDAKIRHRVVAAAPASAPTGAGDSAKSSHSPAKIGATPSVASTQAPSDAAPSTATSKAPATETKTGAVCPPGLDAVMFAKLPPDMQREAIRSADKRAKSQKAAADRASKGTGKNKAAKQQAPAANKTASPAQAPAPSIVKVCEVTLPVETAATTSAAIALNKLLGGMRQCGEILQTCVEADDTAKIYSAADNLMKLQILFDNIEPDGNPDVRSKRKECVKSLNALLDVAEGKGWTTCLK
eukprot:m.411792 g.411792  ORF g.411792 m.411792 type:complete len:324 (-) comp28736_c0_seq1:1725-2696(-)